MSQREKILSAIKNNQPGFVPAPANPIPGAAIKDGLEIFRTCLTSIGGVCKEAGNVQDIKLFIEENFKGRVLSYLPQWKEVTGRVGTGRDLSLRDPDPRQFSNLEVAVVPAAFGVAENGAVWVTDANFERRAIPFICEHLIVVLNPDDVLPTMHDAYEKIGSSNYGFGVFIAGPSKTADIEQSLVLGAHGAKSLTLFLLHGTGN